MPEALTQRWTFSQPSPLGDVNSSWELSAEGLQVRSDASLGGVAETLRWDAVAEAATAVIDLPADKGGPDMVRWMPGQLEWLLASRSDGKRALMQRLPDSEVRDAIVAAARERLGARWLGERLPLPSLQKRFRISQVGDGTKVALLIASVIVVLIVFLFLLVIVSAILLLPAAFVFGGWLFRKGLVGLRDALHAANTPTAKASSAAVGFVELEGRAVCERPTAAGASGVPCVWWDVAVEAWQSAGRGKGGSWRQVMARHGGRVDTLVIEDATGGVPVWLRGADLLLEERVWERGKDRLPAPGAALLAGTAFSWTGNGRVRVRERRMEAGGLVYVLGTL
ncbi:MAG TPA: hypothetical protein VFR30_04075, partial [Lysobacter sp.]|nr:hypothetical protein [Lysobacter sp.]